MKRAEKYIMDDGSEHVHIFCPGCNGYHSLRVKMAKGEEHIDGIWKWNGDEELPTFTPSLLVRGIGVCHSFITDGKIQFLSDSTHHLSGQTVDLPDVDL